MTRQRKRLKKIEGILEEYRYERLTLEQAVNEIQNLFFLEARLKNDEHKYLSEKSFQMGYNAAVLEVLRGSHDGSLPVTA